MYRQFLAFQRTSRRMFCNSARRQLENKVPEKQKMFQVPALVREEDNGMPVHLKGGTRDALLYRFTMVLTVLGAGFVVYELIDSAFPKKKD